MSTEQSYFVPEDSKWPIIAAVTIFLMLFGAGSLIYNTNAATDELVTPSLILLLVGFAGVIFMMFGWFKEVIAESLAHRYDDQVSASFRWGMGAFIFSEVMFFASMFGSMGYVRFLSLDWLAHGGVKVDNILLWPDFVYQWPLLQAPGKDLTPIKEVIDPMHLPLVNTIILVISSITLTIAHKALIIAERKKAIIWTALTVALGVLFLFFQVEEYMDAYQNLDLRLDSNIYGTLFFALTGFHGFHVTIGSIILFVILMRMTKGHFSAKDHFAFEAGAWYWHFVDVVWIALFLTVYIL